jgi:hypothetical protein
LTWLLPPNNSFCIKANEKPDSQSATLTPYGLHCSKVTGKVTGGLIMKALNILLILILIGATSVAADTRGAGFHGIGPRLGLTINPDQVHFGGHVDLGDLAANLMMIPNLEIALGDNQTTTGLSFELDYRFRSDWRSWTPYLGGSAGPIFRSYRHGGSDSDLGLYVQAGIAKELSGMKPSRFFLELKLGLSGTPDGRFTVGWVFGN